MAKAKAQPIEASDVNLKLYELGRDQLRLQQIETEMNEEINNTRKRYANRIDRLSDVIQTRAEQLRLACEDSRQTLLTKAAKSVRLLFGKIGWRTQRDKIKQARGVSGDEAAKRLREHDHEDLVRTKIEVDKKAVLAAISAGELSDADLKTVGLRFVPAGEDWYYETNLDAVQEENAKRGG